MTDELQDLDNLLRHPGWQRFAEAGHREIESRLQNATANAANETNDLIALNKLRQVIAAKQAVEGLLAWPSDRMKVLKMNAANTDTTPQLSRRGSL